MEIIIFIKLTTPVNNTDVLNYMYYIQNTVIILLLFLFLITEAFITSAIKTFTRFINSYACIVFNLMNLFILLEN